MKKFATMTTETQEKRGSKWVTVETETKDIPKECYYNIIDRPASH